MYIEHILSLPKIYLISRGQSNNSLSTSEKVLLGISFKCISKASSQEEGPFGC